MHLDGTRFRHAIYAGLICTALLPGTARAGVLFNNLAFGNSLNSVPLSSTQWAAQSFSTDGNSYQLTNVTVALEGAQIVPASEPSVQVGPSVNVMLYSNSSGSPGALLSTL